MATPRTMTNNSALLDIIRGQFGDEQIKNEFHNQYIQNSNNAMNMVNDERLKYPSLFVLQPEIAKFELDMMLSRRNNIALEISREIISGNNDNGFIYKPEYKSILQWIFKTGYNELNLGDEYDQIIDTAAIMLVREHHDRDSLSSLEEMIFSRHRKGSYTYDAEWALFESRDPDCIALVAKRLLSNDHRDVELAIKMLAFIPCFISNSNEPVKLYSCVMKWLKDNKPYLRYTGENNQKGELPCPYKISLEAKYFHMPYSGESDFYQLPNSDLSRLNRFMELDINTKVMLSDFSTMLNSIDKQQWHRWISGSLQAQIETVVNILGKERRS